MPILAEQNCTHWCFIFVLQLKKRHDLFDCIFALTARFIPVWLLRKSLFACIVLCLSIMRLTLSDTETFEKTLRNKKRGQLRKTADGKQAPQCQCLTWNKCSAFFPKGGSRQADVTGQSLQAQDRTDRETVHTTQSSEWHSFYCSQR